MKINDILGLTSKDKSTRIQPEGQKLLIKAGYAQLVESKSSLEIKLLPLGMKLLGNLICNIETLIPDYSKVDSNLSDSDIKSKNATDSAMIIDAMDLLYTANFNGFCIVSSDSDFTKLASRIRESGLIVYGFGEQKTPSAFVSACDKFIYTEVLRAKTDESKSITKKSSSELKQDTKLVSLLRNAVEASSDESGWAHLAPVGSNLAKQSPDFDPRNYGYVKLGELVKATKLFDIEERQIGDTNSKAIFVRDKRKN